jgi:hypothetical protein
MWRRTELDPDIEYVIQLCQDEAGVRRLRLRDPAREEAHAEAILETGPVSHELLWKQNVYRISEEVRLKDGGRFFFDAHCVWFTEDEVKALSGEQVEIPWCTKKAPVLAPK